MRLKIVGGRVFDPAQGWRGETRDLYVDGDRLVSRLSHVDTVIEARGRAVVPGGLDLRGQVATFGLNFLRLWGLVPHHGRLGELYALQGYTHVHEPFLTLATAGYVHRELAALPVVDVSASLVVNLRDLDLVLKDTERLAELAETLRFFQEKSRTLNFRIMEPWVRHRQEFYNYRTLPLAETLEVLTRLAGELDTTLMLEASPEVLETTLPEPRAFHLSALGPALATDELVDAALAHLERGTPADLGFIWPDKIPGGNGIPVHMDLGLSRPLSLKPEAERDQARRALLLALAGETASAAFSGAGAVLAPVEHYPDFCVWLGDRQARQEFWGEDVQGREFSFFDWISATRTLPARLLGLADRGHLGPGARADIALFDLPQDAEDRWPEHVKICRTLIKSGTVVVEEGRLTQVEAPKAACYRRTGAQSTPLVEELCQFRSFRPENQWRLEDLEGAAWAEV
ncbi:MAG: amidohydrolase family protein [Thermodesulfobacteriota bacterium]